MAAPTLKGQAAAAVKHRGSHMQIIACAGSGKTEVVSQRIVDLLAGGTSPREIVAFTFTEKAATEMKNRITERAAERLGEDQLDLLSGLFVGTIHSFCFQFLQQYVPKYESYDVLDDGQLTAFLSREAYHLGLQSLIGGTVPFAAIPTFLKSIDVIENELLDPASMPEPFRTVLLKYFEALERYRLLTYGQQIARAVQELERPAIRARVHADLKFLIVDEYQDVNRAQERLIELLSGGPAELCVVGDDDQAIYQWRGSVVENIVKFEQRLKQRKQTVATFSLTTNRRSLPAIIDHADKFAATIPGRLPKSMTPDRPATGEPEIQAWVAPTEADEVQTIASLILKHHKRGTRFADMAVLVRTSSAYPKLLKALEDHNVPVQPGGRTGLFDQPEAKALGEAIAWMTGLKWQSVRYGPWEAVGDLDLQGDFVTAFGLTPTQKARVWDYLQEWKTLVPREDRVADLVREYYRLLELLDVAQWDLSDPIQANRMGTLARFSTLLADYESVRRRARPDANAPGEQVGGQDRGEWYYRSLGYHINNYAQGSFDGFDGEPSLDLDAVELTTVHRAKGLEWPVVFVPSLTAQRFPNKGKVGKAQERFVPRDMYDAARYEGSDDDERRLFYVAMTRARDWLSLSRHAKVTSRSSAASPYWEEHQHLEVPVDAIVVSKTQMRDGGADEPIAITFSEIAAFLDCALAYRLRNLIGFQPRLAPELGYGKAVHHVLRTLAEATRTTGKVPTPTELQSILDESFFLPAANKPAHKQLKAAAKRLVDSYATAYQDDLFRIWETERPFELHLNGITVSGRADVILDQEGGVPTGLAILDYKTSVDNAADHALQLQIYADAGKREGLDVRGAYVHDLSGHTDERARTAVTIDEPAISAAEKVVTDAAGRLRKRDFTPSPSKKKCASCDVRSVCGSAE